MKNLIALFMLVMVSTISEAYECRIIAQREGPESIYTNFHAPFNSHIVQDDRFTLFDKSVPTADDCRYVKTSTMSFLRSYNPDSISPGFNIGGTFSDKVYNFPNSGTSRGTPNVFIQRISLDEVDFGFTNSVFNVVIRYKIFSDLGAAQRNLTSTATNIAISVCANTSKSNFTLTKQVQPWGQRGSAQKFVVTCSGGTPTFYQR